MSIEEDQGTARALHALLHETTVPPSRADIGEAVRQGRRAERRRRGAAATAAVLAVLGVVGATTAVLGRSGEARPEPARPTPVVSPGPVGTVTAEVETVPVTVTDRTLECKISPLTLPAETLQVHVRGIDPTGRFVVGAAAIMADRRPRSADGWYVLWDRKTPTLFKVPNPARLGAAVVNAEGVVAGTGNDNPGNGMVREFGWVYRNGQVQRLPMLPGYDAAHVAAITEQGDVVGHAYRLPPEGEMRGGGGAVPVRWRADGSGGPWPLSTPENGGSPVGVTRDGTVVGRHGFDKIRIWRPDGTTADLQMPPGIVRTAGWHVSGDWVAGYVAASDAQSPTPLMRWNIHTGTMYVYPNIDSQGNLGMAVTSTGRTIVSTPEDGFLLVEPDGSVGRLPTPPGAEDWPRKVDANVISDNGLLVGSAYLGPSASEGTGDYTWQCGG
ncbi:hypothetical protein [Plantactinospora endophytica]|uniref:Uncharacterized protein n=1 Tax=Plantactinospora endophytica TaxID=673535 RepID=A0ABQ4EDW7_9ACTN|nr:hypothetical protein [Plantactinospora endophytica]GIG92922.1 hypothetical protein Pen02_78580 [Plantactinospora endophytica]